MRDSFMPGQVIRSGAATQRLTEKVLDYYGRECWLKLPGCKLVATTKDHVLPVDHGGTDAMENLRPACGSCNSKRRNLAISGIGGINVTVFVGPLPERTAQAALEQQGPGDAVIAPTLIRAALGSSVAPAPHLDRLAARAWRTAMDQALRSPGRFAVLIAHPVPTAKQLQQYARLRYTVETIDPGRSIAEDHAAGDRELTREVARWYSLYPEGVASVERVKAHRPTTALARPNPELPAAAGPSRRW